MVGSHAESHTTGNQDIHIPILSKGSPSHSLLYQYRVLFIISGLALSYPFAPPRHLLTLSVVLYTAYVAIIAFTGFRESCTSLTWRTIRLHIDLAFLDYLSVSRPDCFFPVVCLYLIPLLTAIHYPRNRHYMLCSAYVSAHFLLALSLTPEAAVASRMTIAISVIAFFMMCGLILHIYDHAFQRSLLRISIAESFVSNIQPTYTSTEMLENIVDVITKYSQASIGALFLADPSNGPDSCTLTYATEITVDDELTRITETTGLAGRAFAEEEMVYIPSNVASHENYKPFRTLPETMSSLLAVPLSDSQGTCGVIALEFNKDNPLVESELDVIQEFSRLITPLLRQALIYDKDMSQASFIENRLRGQLLSIRSVAHAIRNDFNALVQLHSYILNEDPSSWKQPLLMHLAESMRNVCDRFRSDLNRCLENKDTLRPSYRRISLGEFGETIDRRFRLRCRRNLLNLQLDRKRSNKDVHIEVDPDWMSAIVDNIVSNTIAAYGDDKANRFLMISWAIEQAGDDEGNEVEPSLRIEFKDGAGGIPLQLAEKLSDNIPGYMSLAGEGLNIIKRLTLEMGGRLSCSVDSNPPGTRTVVHIPLRHAEDE